MPKTVAQILGITPETGPRRVKSVTEIIAPSIPVPEQYVKDVRHRRFHEIFRDPRWRAGPDTEQIESMIAKELAIGEIEKSPERIQEMLGKRPYEPKKPESVGTGLARLGRNIPRLVSESFTRSAEIGGKLFPDKPIVPGRAGEILGDVAGAGALGGLQAVGKLVGRGIRAVLPGQLAKSGRMPQAGAPTTEAETLPKKPLTYRDVGEMGAQALDVASYMLPGVGQARLAADLTDLGAGYVKEYAPTVGKFIPVDVKPETAAAIKQQPIRTAAGLPLQILGFKYGPSILRGLGLNKLAKVAPAAIAGIPAIQQASEAAWEAHERGEDPVQAAMKAGVPRAVGFYLGGKIAKFHAENPANVVKKNRLIFLDQITGGKTPTPQDVRHAFELAEGVTGTRGQMLGEARVRRDIPGIRARAKKAQPGRAFGEQLTRESGKGAQPPKRLLERRLSGLKKQLERTKQPVKVQGQIEATQQRLRDMAAGAGPEKAAARSRAVLEAGRGFEPAPTKPGAVAPKTVPGRAVAAPVPVKPTTTPGAPEALGPQIAGGVAAPPPGEFPQPKPGALGKALGGVEAKARGTEYGKARPSLKATEPAVESLWQQAGKEARVEHAQRLRRGAPLPRGAGVTSLKPAIPERIYQKLVSEGTGAKASLAVGTLKKYGAHWLGKIFGEARETKLKRAKNVRGKLAWEDYQQEFQKLPDQAKEAYGRLERLGTEMLRVYTTEDMRRAAYRIVTGRARATDEAMIPPRLRAPLQGHQLEAYRVGQELVEHGYLSPKVLDAHAGTYIRRFYPKHVARMGAEGHRPLRKKLIEWMRGETGELRKRKLTEAESESQGVIQDIVYASVRGLGNEVPLLMRGRMLKMLEGQGFAAKGEAPADWRQLRGPKAGAARRASFGKYADYKFHPDIAADIEFVTNMAEPGWTGKGPIRFLVNQVKRNLVTRNIPTHLRQAVGNYGPGALVPMSFADLMDINILRPDHWQKYVLPAKKLANTNNPLWGEFQATDLPDTDFVSQFLNPVRRAKGPEALLGALSYKYRTGTRGIGGKLKAVDDWVADKYRASDTFLKWMGFLKYRREGYSKADAVAMVKRSTPNYKLVPDRIRNFENSVAGAPFLLFKYDSGRVIMNNLLSARGSLKLAKTLAIMGGFVKAMQAAGYQLDDAELEKMRKAGHYSPLASPLPFKTPQGGVYWFDTRHLAPGGWVLEPMVAAMTGRGEEALSRAVEEGGETAFSQLLLTTVMEGKTGQEGFTERNIYERDEAKYRKAAKAVAHVGKRAVPGMAWYTARDLARLGMEKPRKGSRPRPGVAATLARRLGGVPITPSFPPAEAGRVLKEREKRRKKTGASPLLQDIMEIRRKRR